MYLLLFADRVPLHRKEQYPSPGLKMGTKSFPLSALHPRLTIEIR
jgi:hypothetical protein